MFGKVNGWLIRPPNHQSVKRFHLIAEHPQRVDVEFGHAEVAGVVGPLPRPLAVRDLPRRERAAVAHELGVGFV